MFNAELKDRFLETFQSEAERRNFQTLFRQTEETERILGRDLWGWTQDEVEEFIMGLNVRHTAALRKSAFIRTYLRWCADANGGNVEGEVLELKRVSVRATPENNRLFADPQDLQEFMDSVFEPEEMCRVDNIYRALFWMGFSGIHSKDVLSVRMNDYHRETQEIVLNGQSYPLYAQSIASLDNCLILDKFSRASCVGGKAFEVQLPRMEGDEILRPVAQRNATNKPELRRFMQRANDLIQKKAGGEKYRSIRYSDLYVSGIFCRMHEIELKGIPVSFDILIEGTELYRETAESRLRADYEAWLELVKHVEDSRRIK